MEKNKKTKRGGQIHKKNARKKILKKANETRKKVRNDSIISIRDAIAVPMQESNNDFLDADANDNNNNNNNNNEIDYIQCHSDEKYNVH